MRRCVACVNAFTAGAGKRSGAARKLVVVLRDDLGELIGKAGGLVDRRRRVRACHCPPKRVGKRAIDPLRVGEMVERLRLVETPHLHRPFRRLAFAADGERAVFVARDRHHATIDRRRVRTVHLDLGRAGGLAPVERRIIEERKAHGALDLEGAVAGQKYRRRMGINSLDRRAAMGCGPPEKIDHCLLRGFGRAHLCLRVSATIGRSNDRRTDPNQYAAWPDAVMIRQINLPVLRMEIAVTTLPHTFKRIRLNLARSKEFPQGSARHGYEFVAPLDDKNHIDVKLWQSQSRALRRAPVLGRRRGRAGFLVHKPGGPEHARWVFDYDQTAADDDESGYRFGAHAFRPGEYVSIRDEEGAMHTFVVVSVEPAT